MTEQEKVIARKICDDVALLYEALASDNHKGNVLESEEFKRIRKEILTLESGLEDEAILALILKKYSVYLQSV